MLKMPMKALIQRVSSAHVEIAGTTVARIGKGLLVFLCAIKGDTEQDLDYMVRKVSSLRIFEDEQGKMNRSVMDIKGEVLVVSQFTLAASTRKGNRPSFDNAEAPEQAERMYELFVDRLRNLGVPVRMGTFAAMMQVSLVNDGPVTISLESRED
jgi:D-tyrosyl-tRNA(Tyr) deacylase